MYFARQWYSLADEALEDALYGGQALRAFVGIDLGPEAVPCATTLLKFRRRLEAKGLAEAIFETINALLRERALMLNGDHDGRGHLRRASIEDEQG